MTTFEKVKQLSAILAWTSECYEHMYGEGSYEKAAALMEAMQILGQCILDMCLSHAVYEGEIIPRFTFNEIKEFNIEKTITTLTTLADSDLLRETSERASGLLASVALDLLRVQRIEATPSDSYDLEQTLEAVQ